MTWVYLTGALVSSWLLASRCALSGTGRFLVGGVLLACFEILPVHLMAALQLAGLVERVELMPLAALQLAITAGVVLATRRRAGAIALGEGPIAIPSYVLVSMAIVAIPYLLFAANLLSSYPEGWDAVAYHLPLGLHWLQSGSLAMPLSDFWQFSLPGNAEVGMMLMLATGRQALVTWGNTLALLVLAAACLVLAREWTVSPVARWLAMLLVLSLPLTLYQTFTGYVDLFGTAFVIAAVALFLEWRRAWRLDETVNTTPILAVSALACGISIGTKPVFYVYAGAFLAAVAAYLVTQRRRLPLVRLSIVLAVGVATPALFWAARGVATKGNPIYPLEVKIGRQVILPGYATNEITAENYDEEFARSKAEWLVFPWTEWKRNLDALLIPYSPDTGFGAAFATFVPLGLAFAFYVSFVRESGVWNGRKILLVAFVLLGVVWWVALRRTPRFGFPLIVVACVASSALLDVFTVRARPAFRALLIVSLLSTCAVVGLRPVHAMVSRLSSGDGSRAEHYGYPPVIDRLPPGSRVLNLARTFNNFSLAGAKLTNRVIPDFEAPAVLTQDYLDRYQVDFVIERRDTPAFAGVPAGAVLDESHGFRVWATARAAITE